MQEWAPMISDKLPAHAATDAPAAVIPPDDLIQDSEIVPIDSRYEISPDLDIAEGFRADVRAGDLSPYYLTIVCVYSPISGRYEARTLTAYPAKLDDPPISAAGLRRVRVHEIVRTLAQSNVRGVRDDWRPATSPQHRPRTDDEYRNAAREYVAARIVGDPPLERIVSVYGVSKPTATRIMAEARRRGFNTDG